MRDYLSGIGIQPLLIIPYILLPDLHTTLIQIEEVDQDRGLLVDLTREAETGSMVGREL